MRGVVLFAVGLMIGVAVQVPLAQNQPQNQGVVMMNHVGINVPNIPDAITYYTQKMGYKVAFSTKTPEGQVGLTYLHISQNTFLELNQADAQRPPGFTHYGLHVENVTSAVDMFRQRGIKVTDVNKSASTAAMLANITDPYMGRIELAELTPESLHRKALNSYKP